MTYKDKNLENYMKDKKRPVINENLLNAMNNIRHRRDLKNVNETLKYLLELENYLTKRKMIAEYAVCPDCGIKMSPENVGKIHDHVDSDTNCLGCMKKTFQIQSDKEAEAGIIAKYLEDTASEKQKTVVKASEKQKTVAVKQSRQHQINTNKVQQDQEEEQKELEEQEQEQEQEQDEEEDYDKKYAQLTEEEKDFVMQTNKEGKYKDYKGE